MFLWLMVAQWLFGIFIAVTVSPFAWEGKTRVVSNHVVAAVVLGGLLSALPIALILLRPGWVGTRHVIAFSQMMWSALLIHLTGGRIETHFHVFGSLAFLAFYRDWKVLVTATVTVAADHFVRGLFMPESVYGVAKASVVALPRARRLGGLRGRRAHLRHLAQPQRAAADRRERGAGRGLRRARGAQRRSRHSRAGDGLSAPLPFRRDAMSPEALSPPRVYGYDAANIQEADGKRRTLSRLQYEKLPLAERIRMVLQGRVEFFRDGVAVPANEALKVSAR